MIYKFENIFAFLDHQEFKKAIMSVALKRKYNFEESSSLINAQFEHLPNSTVRCKHCRKILMSNKKSNLKLMHLALASELNLRDDQPGAVQKMPSITIEMDPTFFKTACVKMVTAGGLTFNVFDKPGVSDIFQQIEKGLKIPHINRNNIVTKIDNAAEQFKARIRNELDGKFISLKADSATHRGRSILGVNCQYLQGSTMVVRTLGMMELDEAQTADVLKEEVLKIAQDFGVGIDQIFSITTDNGSNFIKAAELLKKARQVRIFCIYTHLSHRQTWITCTISLIVTSTYLSNICVIHTT